MALLLAREGLENLNEYFLLKPTFINKNKLKQQKLVRD